MEHSCARKKRTNKRTFCLHLHLFLCLPYWSYVMAVKKKSACRHLLAVLVVSFYVCKNTLNTTPFQTWVPLPASCLNECTALFHCLSWAKASPPCLRCGIIWSNMSSNVVIKVWEVVGVVCRGMFTSVPLAQGEGGRDLSWPPASGDSVG